jgi:hypothetical protein
MVKLLFVKRSPPVGAIRSDCRRQTGRSAPDFDLLDSHASGRAA